MINCVFENWSEKWGQWIPNTVHPELFTKFVLPSTHGMSWFDLPSSVYALPPNKETNKKVFEYPAQKIDILHAHKDIRILHYENVGTEKYIYPIYIKSTNYFNDQENIGFDTINPKILQDVRNNKARIILIMPYEGTSGSDTPESWLNGGSDFVILDRWCQKHKLLKHQVFYITANQKISDLTNQYNFTGISVDVFPGWISCNLENPVPFNPHPEKNLFLTYNRKLRLHRVLLACELMKNNLIDKGLISYGYRSLEKTSRYLLHYKNITEYDQLLPYLESITPLELDMNLLENNPASNVHESHYVQTLFSVVPETLYVPNTVFYSEKIWKTIAVGHPFMIISSPEFLHHLKMKGFKTFSKWINEDYDNEPNIVERVKKIVLELTRLNSLSLVERISLRADMMDTLRHNQQLFNSIKREKFMEHPENVVYTEVLKIWNTL